MPSTTLPRARPLSRLLLFRQNAHPHTSHKVIVQQSRILLPQRRNASSTTTSNNESRPLILEKPDKFRPPSHPARIRKRNPRAYGRDMTPEEQAEQARKQYPNMFPPEGTVMYYFLTNRGIHVWISMSVLISIAGYVFFADFHKTNKYPDMLPSGSLFFTHPIQYLSQYISVYKLHVQAVSIETAEKRAKQADEARKRREYLKAHNMEKPGLFGLGTVEQIEAERKRREVLEGAADRMETDAPSVEKQEGDENMYIDFEGKKRPVVKKWLGIW